MIISKEKEKIFFFHSNGFPAKSYEEFFSHLSEYEILYINIIGSGDFPIIKDWVKSVDEVLDFIKRHTDKPAKVLGHSFGGVLSLLACGKHPELFEKVIVIDPPFFRPRIRWVYGLMRFLGLGEKVFKLPTRARARKNKFSSKEEAFKYFYGKGLFRNFTEVSLKNYVEHGLIKDGDNYKLKISPEMESAIFSCMPCFYSPKKYVKMRACVLHAGKGGRGLLTPMDLDWLVKKYPGLSFDTFEGGHMIPFERPQNFAELIKSKLTS